MKKLILLLLLSNFQAASQISVEWSIIYRDTSYSNSIFEALMDDDGNIIVIGVALNQSQFDYNPYIVKYNHTGGLEFEWSLNNINLNYSETIGGADLDSMGNIYIGSNINTFPIDTGRFIKINGNNGQEVFNIPVIDAIIQDILVNDDYVYVLVGSPINSIYKYDLSGNNIWMQPVQNSNSPFKIFNWNQYFGVIGEQYNTSVDSYFNIERYSWNGIFINDININPSPILETFNDFTTDSIFNLWLVGASYDLGVGTDITTFIAVVDTNSIIRDTTVTSFQQSYNGRVGVNELGSGFISVYSSPPIKYSIFKFSNDLQILNEVDSAFSDANPILATDINTDFDNKIITVNRKRRIGTNGDYEISCFDTLGNICWSFDYAWDSTSRENPFKIITNQNDIYIIGLISNSTPAAYGTNILKLNLISSLPEINEHDSLFLYPNPNIYGLVNFSESLIDATVQITDITGKTIYSFSNFEGNQLTLPKIRSGIYFLNINSAKWNSIQKMILF